MCPLRGTGARIPRVRTPLASVPVPWTGLRHRDKTAIRLTNAPIYRSRAGFFLLGGRGEMVARVTTSHMKGVFPYGSGLPRQGPGRLK